MKKIIGISLVVAGAGVVLFRSMNQAPAADLTSDQQALAILEGSSCLSCHAVDAEAPFYASFPVVGDLVKKDMTDGVQRIDLSEALNNLAEGRPIGKVALAKIEKSIQDGTMPLKKFTLLHWGSSMTDAKKEMMLNWARQHRMLHYSNGLAAAAFSNEPVQPIVDSLQVDWRKVILGEMLFHDTRLSADNSVSCASCHGLNTGGVDNLQYSTGIAGQKGGVNAPTVYNAAFNFVQFWDGRATTLADQAAGPPLNPVEMGCLSFDEIITKLEADKNFATAFTSVYPEGLTQATITNAIEEFEKTLITPNSDFDRYLKGDLTALNEQEILGYELFKKNDCATCHVGTNLGGQSYEYMGLTADYFGDRGLELTEEDNGRFKQTQQEYDRHRFKVPGLRNVALTAPYFHDGSQTTLREAVEYMVKYQTNKSVTTAELDAMVAFLNTLTGEYKGQKLTVSL
ncbi:MAG: cytochrome c peroxidase [Bacteroidales bacterium]